MKTVEHKLLSLYPKKNPRLPEEAIKIADNLLKYLQDCGEKCIIPNLNVYGYAKDKLIEDASISIFNSQTDSPEYKKGVDKLYLLIGREVIEKDTELGMTKLKEEYKNKQNRLGLKNNEMHGKLDHLMDIVKIGSEAEWKRIMKEKYEGEK